MEIWKNHMKSYPRLFVLCQELTNAQKKKKGSMESVEMAKQWLDLDRLIVLHSNPSIVNEEWNMPVWSGVAAEKGLDHTQIAME